jgi:predicted metal-dependent hydrolase
MFFGKPEKRKKTSSSRKSSTHRKTVIDVEGIPVQVTFKRMKSLRVTIKPPMGDVRVSVPTRVQMDVVREFIESRLEWIQHHRAEIQARPRSPRLEYVSGELIPVWGTPRTLQVVEERRTPSLTLHPDRLHLRVRPGTSRDRREALVEAWFRDLLREAIPEMIDRWEPEMGVKARSFSVRRMKTRWGSCNTRDRTIRFNTDLISKPVECLEYVVVHELVHLLERSHNARFKGFMDRFMPNWRQIQDVLNERTVPGLMDL